MAGAMFGRGRHGVAHPEVNDSERRHADQIKFGKVHEADYAKALVRVMIGDEDDEDGHLITGWLPMPGARARKDREWHPLEVGEAVVVLSESGETQNGVVIPAGIYSDEDPAPGDKAGLWRKLFEDGGVVEYDRDSGEFLVDAKTKATIKVGDSAVTVEADKIQASVQGGAAILTLEADGIVLGLGAVRLRINATGFYFEGAPIYGEVL